jgi:hypothetical protein
MKLARLCLLAFATLSMPVAAIQVVPVVPFCEPYVVYLSNEVVYVCGDWDEYDFPCPIGDIYIMVDTGDPYFNNQELDDHMGSENAVQGCGGGGAFFDAIIAPPPLPAGKYDLVRTRDEISIAI